MFLWIVCLDPSALQWRHCLNAFENCTCYVELFLDIIQTSFLISDKCFQIHPKVSGSPLFLNRNPKFVDRPGTLVTQFEYCATIVHIFWCLHSFVIPHQSVFKTCIEGEFKLSAHWFSISCFSGIYRFSLRYKYFTRRIQLHRNWSENRDFL